MFNGKPFIQRIADTIRFHRLMSLDHRYLVGLSGGADSVALLLVLKELGYKIEAVHCNFQLRGEESMRDENFCRTLCEQNQVPFHLVHFDTNTYAKVHKVSIEMAARELRYRYFEQLLADLNASAVCVAHHRDDSVETVLMNLIRGTGLQGLKGIDYINGHVVRPLLSVTREEIVSFLQERNQSFMTDSSNLEPVVLRNRIRLEVLPLLEQLNPSAKECIARSAGYLSEAGKMLDDAFAKAKERVYDGQTICLEKLFREASPEYVLFHLLSPYGFNRAQVEEIMRLAITYGPTMDGGGKEWQSSQYQLLWDRGRLILESIDGKEAPTMRIPECGTYVYSNSLKIRVESQMVDASFQLNKSDKTAYFDGSKIVFPLTLRLTQKGDRFVPFGMRGSRLVSDFLTDKKKTLFEKRRQLVLVNGNGDILWVVGERADNRYRLEPETKKALFLQIHDTSV